MHGRSHGLPEDDPAEYLADEPAGENTEISRSMCKFFGSRVCVSRLKIIMQKIGVSGHRTSVSSMDNA